MNEVLIDTDILSYYFKGDKIVVGRFEEYLQIYPVLNISIITYYEILGGLKHKDAKKQIQQFETFISSNNLLYVTKTSASISAEKYGELQKKGITSNASDLLIAGIALELDLSIVTNNEKHYRDISDLIIENWKK
jgi:tRNA(fMet)-specific endonuclease VapC